MPTDAEKEFMQQMVPHHQMAVDMANAVIAAGAKDPMVLQLAQNILKTQTAEIEQMRTWLKANGLEEAESMWPDDMNKGRRKKPMAGMPGM